MSIETTRREFENVIAGGSPNSRSWDLPPLTFSKSENVLNTTIAAADLMMRVLASSRVKLTNEMRSRLLWKLASYVIKAGIRQQNPSLATRAAHAADFLADRPRLINSRMGMGKIIELSQQAERHRQNARARLAECLPPDRPEPAEEPAQLQDGAAPPRSIVWLSLDKRFRLEELVHPLHLVEEGVRMQHCLSWKTQEYWRSIRSGRRRIYSLRRNDEYIGTFTHLDQNVTELTLHRSRDEAVIAAFAEAYRYIDRIHGPLHLCLRDGRYPWLTCALADHQSRFH